MGSSPGQVKSKTIKWVFASLSTKLTALRSKSKDCLVRNSDIAENYSLGVRRQSLTHLPEYLYFSPGPSKIHTSNMLILLLSRKFTINLYSKFIKLLFIKNNKNSIATKVNQFSQCLNLICIALYSSLTCYTIEGWS